MFLEYRIEGRIVPKARPRNNGRQHYLPPRYRLWKQDAIAQLLPQRPIEPHSRVLVKIILVGKHRGDLDNLSGAILDALVQAGVIVDDSVMHIPALSVRYLPDAKQQAHARILIRSL